jgi:hypothetical protein
MSSERLRQAERDLAECEVQLARAVAEGDDHEAETCRAAIVLLQRQIEHLRADERAS